MENILIFCFICSKKAQKCFCETEKCCGYIGGKNANILTDGSKIPKKVSKSKQKKVQLSDDEVDEDEDGKEEEYEEEDEEEEEETESTEKKTLSARYNGMEASFQSLSLVICIIILFFTLLA